MAWFIGCWRAGDRRPADRRARRTSRHRAGLGESSLGLLVAARAGGSAARDRSAGSRRRRSQTESGCRSPQARRPANRRAETAGRAAPAARGGVRLRLHRRSTSSPGRHRSCSGSRSAGRWLCSPPRAIVAGKFVVPQETAVEERGPLLEEQQTEEVVEMIESGGDGISRRKLLIGAGGVAGRRRCSRPRRRRWRRSARR